MGEEGCLLAGKKAMESGKDVSKKTKVRVK